jgi:hypothetical protein
VAAGAWGARLLFWSLVAATLALYALMLAWSIPRISAEAGGLAVFDMRPAGYDLEEARAFLGALTPGGRDFYLQVQHRLDAAYPLLLALACGWAILRLAPPSWGRWRWPLVVPVAAGMVFDWLENRAVAGLLTAGPEGITAALVAETSRLSQLKAAFNTLALSLLLVLLTLRAWQLLRGR